MLSDLQVLILQNGKKLDMLVVATAILVFLEATRGGLLERVKTIDTTNSVFNEMLDELHRRCSVKSVKRESVLHVERFGHTTMRGKVVEAVRAAKDRKTAGQVQTRKLQHRPAIVPPQQNGSDRAHNAIYSVWDNPARRLSDDDNNPRHSSQVSRNTTNHVTQHAAILPLSIQQTAMTVNAAL